MKRDLAAAVSLVPGTSKSGIRSTIVLLVPGTGYMYMYSTPSLQVLYWSTSSVQGDLCHNGHSTTGSSREMGTLSQQSIIESRVLVLSECLLCGFTFWIHACIQHGILNETRNSLSTQVIVLRTL